MDNKHIYLYYNLHADSIGFLTTNHVLISLCHMFNKNMTSNIDKQNGQG